MNATLSQISMIATTMSDDEQLGQPDREMNGLIQESIVITVHNTHKYRTPYASITVRRAIKRRKRSLSLCNLR